MTERLSVSNDDVLSGLKKIGDADEGEHRAKENYTLFRMEDGQHGSYQFRSRISPEKRPRVYECYWAHFEAEIHLSE